MTEHKDNVWQIEDTVLYRLDSRLKNVAVDQKRLSVVAFDLDGTLIKVDNPGVTSSWTIYNEITPQKVREWITKGWHPVIFSNRADAANREAVKEALKKKIDAVLSALGNPPMDVFVAMAKDGYRKPEVGMWKMFLQKRGTSDGVGGRMVREYTGYFVGDAEGPTSSVADFRWSDSDLKFAKATGLTFVTPNVMFS